jgi:hypothetical protein
MIYTCGMSWDVRLWEDVESWVLSLDDESRCGDHPIGV